MYYETELYHHGILGQKWGVRRFQNKDGTLTAAGKKHRSTVANKEESKEKNGLSDKQKKAIIVGASVVGTLLLAYGAYKVNDKATKLLIDSYKTAAKISKNTGDRFLYEAKEYGRMAKEAANGNESFGSPSLLKKMSDPYLANLHFDEANRLNNIANSKFTSKERTKAVKNVLTKGFDKYKQIKVEEILSDSSKKIDEANSAYNKANLEKIFADAREKLLR